MVTSGGVEEDDGVILTPLLHQKHIRLVELLVLDAKSFTEIGRVSFETLGPATPTFHGMFRQS